MPDAKAAAEATEKVRATRVGTVVKAAMDKTVTVSVDNPTQHPTYKKIVRRSKKFLVHDEHQVAGVGDVVRIVECRPRSKSKRWRLLEIVSKAK
ncbi:MAG TPA: 30S ribosomal protein S17 [Acidobacteriota bacterium]|nr:30S ribosomal protein S17 [Acidobacteriota bacterium]